MYQFLLFFDFFLDDPEVIGLFIGRFCPKLTHQIPVKIICGEGGKTGIHNPVQGGIQFFCPFPYDSGLAAAGTAGQEAESVGLGKVIKPEHGKLIMLPELKKIDISYLLKQWKNTRLDNDIC